MTTVATTTPSGWSWKESVYVGTGTPGTSANDTAAFLDFPVPRGVFTKTWDRLDNSVLTIKIVATRRDGTGRLQHAKLYAGNDEDFDNGTLSFDPSVVPTGLAALRWKFHADARADMWHDPEFRVSWTREMNYRDPPATRRQNAPSTIRAAFIWDTPNDRNDMNLSDACLTLEHYVDWK